MRVVVVGASGNVGTSVLRSLSRDPAVDEIIGLCRRRPALAVPKTEWRLADITSSDLRPHFQGADAVVHLAWLIQPGRDLEELTSVNVHGTARVFEAVGAAGVPALVYASSIGAYSPGPKDRPVDESWPTEGIPTSFYARHKAEAERLLDRFEADYPSVRSVRLRPGLIFKRAAAAEIRRLFAGPFLPSPLVRKELIPVVPDVERLVFQAVHSHDVGEAYRLAVLSDVRGPFNIAADPVLDPDRLAEILGAKKVKVPPQVLRAGAKLSFLARLQPTEPGWVDMAFAVPIMDTSRARLDLGWEPRHTAADALLELIGGLRDDAGIDTPPLRPGSLGPLRSREVAAGVGQRLGG